jgi:hypothetical protein
VTAAGGAENGRRMGMASTQLIAAFAVTSFVGALMILQGVSLHLLERRPVRCRACGGVVNRSCTCNRTD